MGVIQTSIFAFLLHEQPFERFRFARWQSVVAITLLGICSGGNSQPESGQRGSNSQRSKTRHAFH